MNKRTEWNKFIISGAFSAHAIPYIAIFVGIIFIISIPLNIDDNRFEFYSGELIRYRTIEGRLHLTVENERFGTVNTIRVNTRVNREKLIPLLPDIDNVRIWARRNVLMQIEADGVLIISYSWWQQTKFFFGMILVGGLLIPAVNRSDRKFRKKEGLPGFREKLMSTYKENTADEDDREGVADHKA